MDDGSMDDGSMDDGSMDDGSMGGNVPERGDDSSSGDDSISGYDDPAGEPPWAMNLVVRVEKAAPPARTEMCEAAAVATVLLLDDERSQPGGVWFAAVQRWQQGRIRKFCRRARGARWDDVRALGAVVARVGQAEVAALVPTATDAQVPLVTKLQMSGFEPSAEPVRADVAALLDAPAFAPGLVIAVNPAVPMSGMKQAVQCAHAAQIAYLELGPVERAAWRADGFAVAVTHPSAADFETFAAAADVSVHDAGFTEIAAGSHTVAARWVA